MGAAGHLCSRGVAEHAVTPRPHTRAVCTSARRIGASQWPTARCLQPSVQRQRWLSQTSRRRTTLAAAASSAAAELFAALQVAPLRDVAATVVTGGGAFAWVKLFNWFAAKEVFDRKLSRKLVHITSGPLYVAMWPLFSSEPYARYCAALICVLNALRLTAIGTGVIEGPNTVRAVSRQGDRRELLRGPLYYILVLIAVTVVYWRESPAGMVAVALMCGGDGIADIVGRRFGKGNPLPHNGNKSWAGSFAMFAGGYGLAMSFVLAFHALGYYSVDVPSAAAAVALISLAATAIESLPINQSIDDNLSVPGIAALISHFMLRACVGVPAL